MTKQCKTCVSGRCDGNKCTLGVNIYLNENEKCGSYLFDKNEIECSYGFESLDSIIYCDENGDIITLGDTIEDTNNMEDEVIQEELIEQLLNVLDDKERAIITLRFFENKTHCEIAELLGLYKGEVARLERKAINKMRKFK